MISPKLQVDTFPMLTNSGDQNTGKAFVAALAAWAVKTRLM